ncbi:hypothetical protein HOD05_04735 [Candidatus Woesearchaeota archaeon]|jgi:hypothetical protein|nr:hypothetical protein [Candidatus Woesearchaeota archaeon]MBT4150459.1 hypothetical protein [Candidatus Woesearchaeota archaeon]MBT4247001.1 hypothetical protein [Candidatus Woesearchaeota archaeon]MBT4434495.1 hypothetical protein [Candidatus Woesearchaeota archaeon]
MSSVDEVIQWLAVEFKYVDELKDNIGHAKKHLEKLMLVQNNLQQSLQRKDKSGVLRTQELLLLKQTKNDINESSEKLRFASKTSFRLDRYINDLNKEFEKVGVPLEYQQNYVEVQDKLRKGLKEHMNLLFHAFNNVRTGIMLLDQHISRGRSVKQLEEFMLSLIEHISTLDATIETVETWISSLIATVKKIEKKRVA